MSIAADSTTLLAVLKHYFLAGSSEAAAAEAPLYLLAGSLPSSELRPTAGASNGYTAARQQLHTVLVVTIARQQHHQRRHHHIVDAASCARADRRLPAVTVHKQLRLHHHSSS